MVKRFKKSFVSPIPITISTQVYGALPTIIPHNPISWLHFGLKYFWICYFKPVPQNLIANISVSIESNCMFKVDNPQDMEKLWDYGFFGKGTLSRSEPMWESTTSRRLHLVDDYDLTNEDITKFRREERIKFKHERAKEQELELKKRKQEITDEELIELNEIKSMLIKFRKSNKLKVKQELQTKINFDDMRLEDQLIVDDATMKLHNIEYLQLSSVEVFFLKFCLDVIDVNHGHGLTLTELFFKCCNTANPKPNNQFILDYVVYHHYRSLGWCVRNGIKFGCDYILYKKGPPFSHAEHGILMLTNDKTIDKDLTELQTISRVIGSVRKNLVLNFIDVPPPQQFNDILFNNDNDNDNEKFYKLLQLYKINEIIYRRWTPNRTRD